jgi:hypothetical protein
MKVEMNTARLSILLFSKTSSGLTVKPSLKTFQHGDRGRHGHPSSLMQGQIWREIVEHL